MRQAIVLRLLRSDARNWWYHKELRQRGEIEEARKRERNSIRSTVRLMRESIIDELNFTRAYITFQRIQGRTENTVSISNVHTGELAAWVYVYAHNIGQRPIQVRRHNHGVR